MEKLNYLVSWPSPSVSEKLSLKLIQVPLRTKSCTSSQTKSYILSDSSDLYTLDPELKPVKTPYKITSISCNASMALLLTSSGLSLIFGEDPENSGMLGIQNVHSIKSPTPIPSLQDFTATSCGVGKSHAAVTLKNGSLYTWGSNSSNQLGKDLIVPSQVDSASIFSASKVSCGPSCTVILTGGGFLYSFGPIGKSPFCRASAKHSTPFILPELEYHFTKNFSVGQDYIAALTSTGEIFVYDDCAVLVKVPTSFRVSSIATSLNAMYSLEKDTKYLYEWSLCPNELLDCNLQSLSAKVYKIGHAKIFDSHSDCMLATVSEGTAGKFLFNVDNELTLTIPTRFLPSPVHSPAKRVPFKRLSKKFSLNIDNLAVIKIDSVNAVVDILVKLVRKVFNAVRGEVSRQKLYSQAVLKNTTASDLLDAVKKIVIFGVRFGFRQIFWVSQEKKNRNHKKIKDFLLDTYVQLHDQKFRKLRAVRFIFKRLARSCLAKSFGKFKNLEKIERSADSVRYGMLVFFSSVEKTIVKQKNSVFSLLLRVGLQKKNFEDLEKSPDRAGSRIKSRQSSIDLTSIRKSCALFKFALIFQKFCEKTRSAKLLRALKVFRTCARVECSITPSLISGPTEKTYAESFDNTILKNLYSKISPEKNVPRLDRKKLSSDFTNRTPNKLIFKEINDVFVCFTDRRHSTESKEPGSQRKTQGPKKPNDLRKAYDLGLKSKRFNMIKNKNLTKSKEIRTARLSLLKQRMLKLEAKFAKIFRKALATAVCVITKDLIATPKQLWKIKIYQLGTYKLKLCLKKRLKTILLSITLH